MHVFRENRPLQVPSPNRAAPEPMQPIPPIPLLLSAEEGGRVSLTLVLWAR